MDKKKIEVCPRCEKPLVFTFIIPGNEWFCISCKWSGGVFYEKKVDSTPELIKQKSIIDKEFEKIRVGYVPPRSFCNDCEKCEDYQDFHEDHLTFEQLEAHNRAKEALFNPSKQQ